MKKDSIKVEAPGRINIIGEHTDYNDGYVLPAAIDKKTTFELHQNGHPDRVVLTSAQNESITLNLADHILLANGWQSYLIGVIRELQKYNSNIHGFNGTFYGDVPIGAGLSSSAALECSLAFGLNALFNLGLDHWQLIRACQMAEHNYVGIKCGIMDQFASIIGKKDQVMLLDCRSLDFTYIQLELEAYEFLLLNTNVSHSLASSEYNNRRAECEDGVKLIQRDHPHVQNLRDVTLEMLNQSASHLPTIVHNRCRHIVTENERVLKAVNMLNNKNYIQLGKLMNASHHSLQNDYEVSCRELDFLAGLAQQQHYVLGSRMMGGGFGGCTINLIEKKRTSEFIEMASINYKEHFGFELTPYLVKIGDGARIVEGKKEKE